MSPAAQMKRKTTLPTDKNTRKPRQQRSQERVNSILKASKELIVEKGSAGLQIQEIALRAGVTAGSMYQYFPNKAAIIHALAEHYIEFVHDMVSKGIKKPPSNLEECVESLNLLLDSFYLLYREDPVLREIWVSTAVDKNMQDMDLEDSRRNADLIFPHICKLFPEAQWPRLKQFLFLAMHMCGSIVRLALRVEQSEGEQLIEISKKMLSAGLLQTLDG